MGATPSFVILLASFFSNRQAVIPMETSDSYSKAVLLTAWHHSRALLQSRLSTSIVAAISLVFGAIAQWQLNGLAADTHSLIGGAICSIATALALFAAKFLWHLILAPFEIIQNEIRPVLQNAGIFGVPRPPNYDIWKHRKSYNPSEFAALLVGLGPGSSQTVDYLSMLNLVLEDLRGGGLKYSMPPGSSPTTSPGYIPDTSVIIAKNDVLTRASAHSFDKAIKPLQ
jgi:hypothetical protein